MSSASASSSTQTPTKVDIPADWPGAFGIYKISKQAVCNNLWPIVGLYLAAIVIDMIIGILFKDTAGGRLVSGVVGVLFWVSLTLTYIESVRGREISVDEALRRGLSFWLRGIGLYLLVGLSYVVSLVLLIIPFFFVYPRLVMAPYFLVDKKLGVFDAYQASWEATRGHALKAWGIVGAAIVMALPILTIIGIPFAIYFLLMYSAAYAVLYESAGKKAPLPAKKGA